MRNTGFDLVRFWSEVTRRSVKSGLRAAFFDHQKPSPIPLDRILKKAYNINVRKEAG